MDDKTLSAGTELIKHGAGILDKLPTRKRSNIDDVEVVFVDMLNGKLKHNRAYCFVDILEKLGDGSKPIGLLLLRWDYPEKIEAKEFPDITTEEQELLHYAMAEAQDQVKEDEDGD